MLVTILALAAAIGLVAAVLAAERYMDLGDLHLD